MKNLKMQTMALLAAGVMAACSSTRTGSGGSSGTTGIGMGSSSDVGTTAGNTTSSMGTSSSGDDGSVITNGTVGSEYSTSTSATVNPGINSSDTYSNNTGSNYNSGTSLNSNSNGSWYGSNDGYTSSMNNNSVNNDSSGAGTTSGWWGSGTNNTYGSSPVGFFMNGYQGPLNYSDFSSYSSAQSFLPIAAESGMREVELSRIAQQKSSNPDVRAFAEMMIRDHSASNQQLINVASTQNVTIATPAFVNAGNMSGSYGANANMSTSGSMDVNGSMGAGGSVNSGSGYSGNTSGSVSTSGSMSINNSGSDNNAAMMTMNELTSLHNLSGQQFDQQYMRMMLQDHYQAIALFQSAARSDDAQVKAFAQKTLPTLQTHLAHAKMVKRRLF